MTGSPLRLVVLRSAGDSKRDPQGRQPHGPDSPGNGPLQPHQSAFEVIEVENAEQARRLLDGATPDSLVVSSEVAKLLAEDTAKDVAEDDEGDLSPPALLQSIGDGVGVVSADGTLAWCGRRLAHMDASTRQRFSELCREALEQWTGSGPMDPAYPVSRKFSLMSGEREYELVASPAAFDGEKRVKAVVGILWDITSSQRLRRKIDAIDAAGSELMRIEASAISRLNMADRLRLLEEKIVQYVHDLLEFDNFEIRLLDHQTNRLELVVAVGLSPLKIGEVIHAEPEGNGISGYVASTGHSYICDDVQRDALYRDGLDNAASTLTVPLRLHDEVIGVFNVESNTPGAFDDNDRQFTEIFGRYVAMAMHILDLMVVERYTTNEQVSANVLSELSLPIEEITTKTQALVDDVGQGVTDPQALQQDLQDIRTAAQDIRNRMEVCARGPRTILGAEAELRKFETDPLFAGRRVIIADNEEEISETMYQLLLQKGCDVVRFCNGSETIAAIEASADQPFELVISDIKMPDRNGYEIFRATRAVSDKTRVILMTGFGYDPHHSIIRASQEGLHSLLFKPFKATQLFDVMRKAFEADNDAGPQRQTRTKKKA